VTHRCAPARGGYVTRCRAGRPWSGVRPRRPDAWRRPHGGSIGPAGCLSARWPPPWVRSERSMTRPVPEPGGSASPVQSGAWGQRVSGGAHPSSAAAWTPDAERSSAGGPATLWRWRDGARWHRRLARRQSGLARPRTLPCASPRYDPGDGRRRAAREGGACDGAAQGRSALSTPVFGPWPAAVPGALRPSRARRARGARRRQRRRRQAERWGSVATGPPAPPTRRRSRGTAAQPRPRWPAVSPRSEAAGPERRQQARRQAPEPLRAPGERLRRRIRWTIPRSRWAHHRRGLGPPARVRDA
jgi:hypothetical protein